MKASAVDGPPRPPGKASRSRLVRWCSRCRPPAAVPGHWTGLDCRWPVGELGFPGRRTGARMASNAVTRTEDASVRTVVVAVAANLLVAVAKADVRDGLGQAVAAEPWVAEVAKLTAVYVGPGSLLVLATWCRSGAPTFSGASVGCVVGCWRCPRSPRWRSPRSSHRAPRARSAARRPSRTSPRPPGLPGLDGSPTG